MKVNTSSKFVGLICPILVLGLTLAAYSGRRDRFTDQSPLFTFVRSVQVTPNNIADGGGFARTWHVPATGSLVVIFYGPSKAIGINPTGCEKAGNFYKEYTLEMDETGREGAVQCAPLGNDFGSLMTGSMFYTANTIFDRSSERKGWLLAEYDVSAGETAARVLMS